MVLPKITAPTGSYTFTLYCRDTGTGVLNSSIKTGSIRVVAPSFDKLPTLLSKSPAVANSNFISATFQVDGPFDTTTNGFYEVIAIAGETQDVAGNLLPESVVGRFECAIATVNTEPVISLGAPLGSLYTADEKYYAVIQATDVENKIDTSDLDKGDVRLIGNNNTDRSASSINLVLNESQSSAFILATWDGPFAADVAYSIRLSANSIKNQVGVAIAQTNIPEAIVAQQSASSSGGSQNVKFDDGSVTAVPGDWIIPEGAIASIEPCGLLIRGDGSGGWVFNAKSPNIPVVDGLIVEVTASTINGLGGFGFTSETGSWGSFSNDDILFYSAGGDGTGGLHVGNQEVLNGTGYDASVANRLRVEFGSTDMEVIMLKDDGSGSFVEGARITRAIPDEFEDGIRVLASPHGSNSVCLAGYSVIADESGPKNVVSQRTVPSEFFGYNGAALAIADWDTVDKAKFGASTARAGASILRWPGGDESNFWDYTRNGLITNSEDILPLAWWHTHGRTLPIWLAYQIDKTTASPANIKAFHDEVGTLGFIYVVNCTNSTPAKQILALQAHEAVGFTITHIELGNELFFNVPYYVGDEEHPLRGHTSPAAFATDMVNNWIPAMRSQWPNAKIYVLGTPDYSFQYGREANWNYALNDAGAFASGMADGITIHPYYNIIDLNLDKSAVGSEGRASAAGKLAHDELGKILKSRSLSILPEGTEIICTEFSVLEDSSQTGFVVYGQTWSQALVQVQNVMVMLRDRRCTMALLHSLLSNPQWEGVTGEKGTGMDATKRGVVDVPFTDGLYEPLLETIQGYLLGRFANEALNGGGDGYLLVDRPGYMAWRIKSSTRDRIAICNTTGDVHNFVPPLGSDWTYEQESNKAWFEVTRPSQIPTPKTGALVDGDAIAIPAFSLTILSGNGNAAIEGQIQPPSIVLTPPSSRLNSQRFISVTDLSNEPPSTTINLITFRPI